MHALYETRGYRTFITLLSLQATAFAGLLMASAMTTAIATPVAQWLPRALALWMMTGALAAFMSWTWATLSEAGFCLRLVTWEQYLRYQLRPLLLLSPVALAGSDILHATGVGAWWSRIPVLVVGTLGLLCTVMGLVQVLTISRQVQKRDLARTATLASLTRRYGEKATQRLSDSLHYARGLIQANPFQMRRGFLLADLSSTAWHETSEFAWTTEFEKAATEIRAEALKACFKGTLDSYDYPGAVQGDWNVFWLVRDNRLTPEAEALCPATARALKQVPGFPCMREAHFSVLQPHSRILPHCDESNTWVTGHFGIQIPESCGIRVGRETRNWKEGEFLFFDTSYQHEAWNDSDTPRVVLLFDFIHPRLTEPEREFLIQTRSRAATTSTPILADDAS